MRIVKTVILLLIYVAALFMVGAFCFWKVYEAEALNAQLQEANEARATLEIRLEQTERASAENAAKLGEAKEKQFLRGIYAMCRVIGKEVGVTDPLLAERCLNMVESAKIQKAVDKEWYGLDTPLKNDGQGEALPELERGYPKDQAAY